MDLSFQRFEKDRAGIAMPPVLAVLFVGMAARQAMSPTARIEQRLRAIPRAAALLAPLHGAFSLPMARLIAAWKEE